MRTFIEFKEISPHGQPKGQIVINIDAIIHIREVTILGQIKGCRVTTKELSIDSIAAETFAATASYSDCVLVAGSIKDFYARIEAAQAPVGTPNQ